jgi:hypothetical protein
VKNNRHAYDAYNRLGMILTKRTCHGDSRGQTCKKGQLKQLLYNSYNAKIQ